MRRIRLSKEYNSPLEKEVKRSHAELIAHLQTQITQLDKQVSVLLAQDEDCAARLKRLQTFKGVGAHTSHMLVACLPELGQSDRNHITALVGLAPKVHESGRKSGQRYITGGRSDVRKALYMAGLASIRHNTAMKAYYQGLIARGKKGKVALVAVMRKILVILNAMLRTGSDGQAERYIDVMA